jgi:uncharacterized protein (UPF0335 family)
MLLLPNYQDMLKYLNEEIKEEAQEEKILSSLNKRIQSALHNLKIDNQKSDEQMTELNGYIGKFERSERKDVDIEKKIHNLFVSIFNSITSFDHRIIRPVLTIKELKKVKNDQFDSHEMKVKKGVNPMTGIKHFDHVKNKFLLKFFPNSLDQRIETLLNRLLKIKKKLQNITNLFHSHWKILHESETTKHHLQHIYLRWQNLSENLSKIELNTSQKVDIGVSKSGNVTEPNAIKLKKDTETKRNAFLFTTSDMNKTILEYMALK